MYVLGVSSKVESAVYAGSLRRPLRYLSHQFVWQGGSTPAWFDCILYHHVHAMKQGISITHSLDRLSRCTVGYLWSKQDYDKMRIRPLVKTYPPRHLFRFVWIRSHQAEKTRLYEVHTKYGKLWTIEFGQPLVAKKRHGQVTIQVFSFIMIVIVIIIVISIILSQLGSVMNTLWHTSTP